VVERCRFLLVTAVGCVSWGCLVTAPYDDTRLDLIEAIALAEAGLIEAGKDILSA
jgi:hypothetical protein